MYPKYAIVTPVKNEEAFLPRTIEAVVNQTLLPARWMIVDDGSTDRTSAIIKEAEATYPWIRSAQNVTVQDRAPGGKGVVHLGLERLHLPDYDYLARLDGDISFAPNFFETLFNEFDKNPKLGIGSGVCHLMTAKGLSEEKRARFHTRGATKVYRMACYQAIGGLQACLGWDGADEIKAHMLGWQTYSLPQLQVMHHRETQTSNGALKGKINLGKAAYYLGYHPLFMFARAAYHMAQAPYLSGGLWLLAGYLGGYLKRRSRIPDPDLIAFVRAQQWRRMTGRESMWK